jgi:membrane dipeptidase
MYADGHSDYLFKAFNNYHAVSSISELIKAQVRIQNFAIFVESSIPSQMVHEIFAQIELFNQSLKDNKDAQILLSASDFDLPSKLFALLSLEGSDIISHDVKYFKKLWSLGVRMYSLTWNNDNNLATSCYSKHKTGLTEKGIELIKKINSKKGIIDISHISEYAFWDIINITDEQLGLVASHSNCKSICDHVRNLTDLQIRKIIERKGIIGINLVPIFLKKSGNASISDVVKHIEKVIDLGGVNNVAIGSDFDGAEVITELATPMAFPALVNELSKMYSQAVINKIMYYNWDNFLKNKLPI